MSAGVKWEKWDPQGVREAALKELEANGAIVGKFVEGEARRRLDAISQPSNKRAVAYRAFLSRWVLTNTVKREGNAVVISVGMRRGPGKKGEMRGFYIEIGSRTAPARSFLRQAVWDNRKTIMATLTGK